jgi:hypothetical protein
MHKGIYKGDGKCEENVGENNRERGNKIFTRYRSYTSELDHHGSQILHCWCATPSERMFMLFL